MAKTGNRLTLKVEVDFNGLNPIFSASYSVGTTDDAGLTQVRVLASADLTDKDITRAMQVLVAAAIADVKAKEEMA